MCHHGPWNKPHWEVTYISFISYNNAEALLEPSDLKIFCAIETNSTHFCESTGYYPHTRLFLIIEFNRQTKSLRYAPGLYTAVSIVGPELSCLGHFPHYLHSPLFVSASMTMTLTVGGTHSQYQYWGSA